MKWKKTFESKGLMVNIKKTNAVVSGSRKENSRGKLIHGPSVVGGRWKTQ